MSEALADFIIVGRGLAATTMMHALHQHSLKFVCIGDPSLSSSSRIAAGIWNPVVFKRMTASWMARELTKTLLEFYRRCEKDMKVQLVTTRELVRPFSEEQEELLWQKKSETDLKGIIDPAIYRDTSSMPQFKILRGYGVVKNCGNLDVPKFIDHTADHFRDFIRDETFAHDELQIHDEYISYRNLRARNIVFCEGHLVKNNPFFSWVPLKPAKGEILEFHSEDLDLGLKIFNRNGFVFRLAPGLFKTGSTYQWDELDDLPTAPRRNELEEKLRTMITGNYQVVSHRAGVRPSSHDLRPVSGQHPKHRRLWLLNGLGSKGVMLAPFFCKNFVHCYLEKAPLNAEVSVERYYHLYETQKD